MDFKQIKNQIQAFFKSKTVFTNIILVNIIVFAFIQVVHVIAYMMKLDSWLVFTEQEKFLKLTWNYLASTSDLEQFLIRPWSLITYMFTHEGFMHLAGNMIMLYFFGKYLYTFLGGRKLLSTYLLGGIAGWVLFVIGFNFLPVLVEKGHGPMWGASAAVMACVVGAATYSPNLKINLLYAQVSFKYIAGALVILDFLALDDGINAGGHLGHLGGAIYGFIMIKQLQKGRDINKWFEKFIDKLLGLFNRNPKMKVVYNKSKAAKQTDEEYNYDKAKAQKRVDAILEKISKGGYGSLTKAEKDFLNKFSAK